MNTRPLMIEVPNGTHVKWIDDNGVEHFGQTSRTFHGPKHYICRRADGTEAIVPAMKLELIEDPNAKKPHPLTDDGGAVSAALSPSSVEGTAPSTGAVRQASIEFDATVKPAPDGLGVDHVLEPVEGSATLVTPIPAATEAPKSEVPVEAAPSPVAPVEAATPVVEAPATPTVTDAAPTPVENETPAQ